jgi:hypothetical protein
MKFGLLAIAAVGVTLSACGVYGPKGNDTGGIIPWSLENEQNAFAIAQANCGSFNKYAVATSIHRVYGDYIGYTCQWDPPVAVVSRPRARRHVNVTIDK